MKCEVVWIGMKGPFYVGNDESRAITCTKVDERTTRGIPDDARM